MPDNLIAIKKVGGFEAKRMAELVHYPFAKQQNLRLISIRIKWDITASEAPPPIQTPTRGLDTGV